MATNSKGQAWFCTTGLPSDVVVDVDDMTFHLHKFPLMAKCRKLHDLITEQEANVTPNREQENEEIQEENEAAAEAEEERHCRVRFPDFPGGPEAFETAAKFCYAVKIELTPSNVASLRCAGEALEMTEEYSEGNLISKTERFLSQTVFRSLRDSIQTLKSCERLIPLAERLGVVERCIDSIAAKVSAMDPSLFGWPVNEPSNAGAANPHGHGDWWLDELTFLAPPFFKRVIHAMKGQHLSYEIIENCLLRFAKTHIPGSIGHPGSRCRPLYLQRSSTTVKLFFGMLRTANILNTSDETKSTLEKKIGSRFELATLDDLLMPSYSYLTETLYDVDCVQRILTHFLDSVEDGTPALTLVGKLIDGYLSEIALDANLKPGKFCELAGALPEQARVYDDGLYRSVDVYIKAHQWIPESDRERVSSVLDCRKLTLEACTHAAQNERLPLRAVVQVLFFEQLQLRHAIAGTLMAVDVAPFESEISPVRRQQEVVAVGEDDEMVVVEEGEEEQEDGTWRAAVRENQVLRLGMDSMRTRVHELERECTTMRKAIEKIDHVEAPGWRRRGSLTRKFGCKFKTQVCDSHESTMVESRKARTNRTNHHHNR
ncbi:hypothetical protein OSB04_000040 [Centaurea solstitialis]|uniref:Phototropic-responsive NPH3 family protein n=1 Tax=Centaurea solstitialis TaxID=347529 RepID=A0AA38TNG3_9ASTR|nr:hypothetical protein OSB04_000040 [Centaurea solstitialis]